MSVYRIDNNKEFSLLLSLTGAGFWEWKKLAVLLMWYIREDGG